MNNLKRIFTLSLILLLQPFNTEAAKDDNIVIAGLAACAAGLLWCGNKIFKSSSYSSAEKRLESIKQKITSSDNRYSQLCLFNPQGQVTEKNLAAFAQRLPIKQSISQIQKELKNTLSLLEKDRSFLKKNINNWRNDNYYQNLLHSAMPLLRKLNDKINELRDLHTYFVTHQEYFKAKQQLEYLKKEYTQEFSKIATTGYFDAQWQRELEIIIKTKHFNPNHGFPLVAYAEKIEPDIQSFIKKCNYIQHQTTYTQLLQEAHAITNKLNHIKTFIATNYEYQQERSEYAKYQQNEDLVRARQQEVRLIAEKNRIARKHLEEEQKKNDLLASQNSINREKSRQYERYARHIPELQNLLYDTQRAIKAVGQEIKELKERINVAAGFNPQCQEYQILLHEIQRKKQDLNNLYRQLDRISEKIKSHNSEFFR